jgi:hypothetical protein
MDIATLSPKDRLTLQLSYQWVFEAIAESDHRIAGEEIDAVSKLLLLAAEAPDEVSRQSLRDVADPSEEYLKGCEDDVRDWRQGFADLLELLPRICSEQESLAFRKTLAGISIELATASEESGDVPAKGLEARLVEVVFALGLTNKEYLSLEQDGKLWDFVTRMEDERHYPHDILEKLRAAAAEREGQTGILFYGNEEEGATAYTIAADPGAGGHTVLQPGAMEFVPLQPAVETTITVNRVEDAGRFDPIVVSVTLNDGEIVRAVLSLPEGDDETAELAFLDGDA